MPYKESREKATIQRCPHDKENPYAQISRDLIRDNTISPNCRMVLIYLLSNDDKTWVIRPPQLYKQFKQYLGRDAIYKIIDDAIKAGYIKREEYLEGNFKRYKYYLSETPKFKNIFLYPKSQYTGAPYTENQDTLERKCEEEKYNKTVCSSPPVGASPLENQTKEKESEYCEKMHPDGHKLKISKQELISESIKQHKDFKLTEIEEAWRVLVECKQLIRNPLRYLEGVIENIRNSKTHVAITRKTKEKKECQQKIEKEPVKEEKPRKTGKSLLQLLEERQAETRKKFLEQKEEELKKKKE